jgi:acetyltransferase-like isoleucine patch superfamily enzyme
MKLFKKIIKIFTEKRALYLLSGSKVTIEKGGIFKTGKNVTIQNSNIYVKKGDNLSIGDNTHVSNVSISMITGQKSELRIGKNCIIKGFDFSMTNGQIVIGDGNILEKGDKAEIPSFKVTGKLIIRDYNRLRCSIWIRFNGNVEIGSRNAINEGTEVRSDEAIVIGDYNQISYDCMIWDTNTHSLYKAEKRREITDKQYPAFGLEFEKPATMPVSIGSDCWIGKGASILKGTRIASKCIVGYGALLSNISIAGNKTIINQPNLKLIDNQL